MMQASLADRVMASIAQLGVGVTVVIIFAAVLFALAMVPQSIRDRLRWQRPLLVFGGIVLLGHFAVSLRFYDALDDMTALTRSPELEAGGFQQFRSALNDLDGKLQASSPRVLWGTQGRTLTEEGGPPTHGTVEVRSEITVDGWLRLGLIAAVGLAILIGFSRWRRLVAKPRLYALTGCAIAAANVGVAWWWGSEAYGLWLAIDLNRFF
jgi:hypothetical protein